MCEKEKIRAGMIEGIDRLLKRYEEVREKMIDFEKSLKEKSGYFKPGAIYLGLRYCGRSNCYFCPHSFVWEESYLVGNKLRSRVIGNTITKAFLKKRYKSELYLYFKQLERQAKAIEKERNKYAGYIISLRSELRRLARRNPRTT
jgi:hypothetical protein